MPRLQIALTGVNAYVLSPSAVTVVMPNATRLGPSTPSTFPSPDLPMHMPTLWSPPQVSPTDCVPGPRTPFPIPFHFPWARLEIEALDAGGAAITGVEASEFAGVASRLPIPASAAALPPGDPDRVAGQMVLSAGDLSAEMGPCQVVSWTNETTGVDVGALVNILLVTIQNVARIVVSTRSFFSPGTKATRADLDLSEDVFLFAGNVCSKDVLRWPRNDRPIDPEETSFSDEDFGWMYKLADPGDIITSGDPPLPRIAESGCGFDASMTFEAVADQAADWFCQEAGGGGCGCQCLGCLAEVQEE